MLTGYELGIADVKAFCRMSILGASNFMSNEVNLSYTINKTHFYKEACISTFFKQRESHKRLMKLRMGVHITCSES